MPVVIDCPVCAKPVGSVSSKSPLEVVCPTCRYKYGVVLGKLTKPSSEQITLQRKTTRQPGTYDRRYELRIKRPNQKLEVFSFVIPGKDDHVLVRHGDTVSVIHTMRGDHLEDLVLISNHTTGEQYRLEDPGSKTRYIPLIAGLWAAAATYILLLLAPFPNSNDAGRFFALLIPLPSGAFAYEYMRKKTTLKVEIGRSEERRLTEEQGLLSQKTQLQQRVGELLAEVWANEEMMEQLEILKQKMIGVGQDVYGSRIGRIEKAIGLLQEQVEGTALLIKEYDRTIKIIEIEYEASRMAAGLPDKSTSTLAVRMAEMTAAEEKNQDLRLQLEANEEVRRLRA